MLTFKAIYFLSELLVERSSILCVVNPSVTVRAKCSHPGRMIGPTIGTATNVVGLEVRTVLGCDKRRRLVAAFTAPVGTPEDVDANGYTALIGICFPL